MQGFLNIMILGVISVALITMPFFASLSSLSLIYGGESKLLQENSMNISRQDIFKKLDIASPQFPILDSKSGILFLVSNSTTIYALKNGDVKFSKDFKNYPFLSINEYDDEYFAGLALDPVQNKIYATNGNDTVIVLNYSLGVIDTLDVFKKYGDSRIRGIGIDPDLQTIFVTNSDFDPDMIALNLSTRKIVGEIATEDYHDEIIVDRDTHLVYSIDNEEHLLNIIDEKSNGFFNVSLGDFAPRDLVSYKDGKILLIDDSASRLLWIDRSHFWTR